MSSDYSLVVLGAGGVGSAAFFHAARSGQKVLALEQFGPAHDRGSSHGQTRIIRQAYFEHPNYVPILRESYELWRELEQVSGRNLFFETGLLEVGPSAGPLIQGVLRSASEHQLAIEEISDSQFAIRFATFRKSADQVALFERQAGYLLVEACVQAHLDAAVAAGGEFRPFSRVDEIQSHKSRVRIATDRGDVFADRLIVAAGSWTTTVLPQLSVALEVRRKHQYWFPFADPRFKSSAGAPAYLFETDDGYFYGFPVIDGELAKVARHTGGERISNPTLVDRSIDLNDLSKVCAFVGKCFGQTVAQPARHSVCMYTMSPDEHFVVDRHPDNPQIVYCAGLSGHGFKFAPALGKYLVQLSEGSPDRRFDFLRSTRFAELI